VKKTDKGNGAQPIGPVKIKEGKSRSEIKNADEKKEGIGRKSIDRVSKPPARTGGGNQDIFANERRL